MVVTVASSNKGATVGQGGFLSEWDGYSWVNQATPTNLRLNSVDLINAEGWAVGENGIILVKQESREISPIQQASITGPTMGLTTTDYTFTVNVFPLTATVPITYVWQGSEQLVVMTNSTTTSHTISYTWNITGLKAITLTATNEGSIVTATQSSPRRPMARLLLRIRWFCLGKSLQGQRWMDTISTWTARSSRRPKPF